VLGYRSVFDTSGGYVEAAVRIEGGARPDPEPAETRQIIPYVASEMRAGSNLAISNVMTVKAERTFWEKALILHAMTEMTEKRTRSRMRKERSPTLIDTRATTTMFTRSGTTPTTGRRRHPCSILPKRAGSTRN
jgi:hypothetical protein